MVKREFSRESGKVRENEEEIMLERAKSVCARREYCAYDIRQKLMQWDCSQAEQDKIIEILVRESFIDEQRYANSFVRDRFRFNNWGKVKITAALKMKKIPDKIIQLALAGIDDKEYLDLIKKLIDVQNKKIRAGSIYERKGKLFRFGASKGFESNILYDLLNYYD